MLKKSFFARKMSQFCTSLSNRKIYWNKLIQHVSQDWLQFVLSIFSVTLNCYFALQSVPFPFSVVFAFGFVAAFLESHLNNNNKRRKMIIFALNVNSCIYSYIVIINLLFGHICFCSFFLFHGIMFVSPFGWIIFACFRNQKIIKFVWFKRLVFFVYNKKSIPIYLQQVECKFVRWPANAIIFH